jgi:nitrogen regulatory protein P-II 1
MKKIEAVIRKTKFEEVYKKLEGSGIGGLTVYDVRGFGHHRNGLRDWVRLEIYADEFQVEKTVDLILRTARSSNGSGDGKVAVLNMDNIYRISTGEGGANAI